MPYKKKFKRGARIKTTTQAVRLILAGKWIFCHGKPMHHGWTRSWQLGLLNLYVNAGSLYQAKENT
jgi:hypothetical protein